MDSRSRWLESIAAVNSGLESVKCNVLLACHDHQLVETVANRVLCFNADGTVTDYRTDYDTYLEKTAAHEAEA